MIFLPIESASRELRSKALVAEYLVSQGCPVTIITNRMLHSASLRDGVVLLKSAANFELPKIKALKSYGNTLTVLDEEGIFAVDEEVGTRSRYSQDTLDCMDCVFFNGDLEEDVLRSIFRVGRSIVSGNPRFDRAKKRKEEGRYILISSRFGDANPDFNMNIFEQLDKVQFTTDSTQRTHFTNLLDYNKNLFRQYSQMVVQLVSKFPEKKFVIRPHPSEKAEFWISLLANKPNAEVTKKNDIGFWLGSAIALVHNGCTTALDAHRLGVPRVSFCPITNKDFDAAVPNQISHIVDNFEDLSSFIEAPYSFSNPNIDEELVRVLHNFDPDIDAWRMIGDELQRLKDMSAETGKIDKLRYYSYLVTLELRRFLEIFDGNDAVSYSFRKCPRLDSRDIVEYFPDKLLTIESCNIELSREFIQFTPTTTGH